MHGRKRILRLANVMNAVAIDASGNLRVASSETLAVHAGAVLRQLIHPLPRLVLLHETGVAVAMRAPFRHGGARNLSYESASLVHSRFRIHFVAISAMAVRATESEARVDIVGEGFCGRLQFAFEHGVAVHTGIRGRQWKYEQQCQHAVSHRQYPSAEKVVR